MTFSLGSFYKIHFPYNPHQNYWLNRRAKVRFNNKNKIYVFMPSSWTFFHPFTMFISSFPQNQCSSLGVICHFMSSANTLKWFTEAVCVCRYPSSPRRTGAHDSSSRLPGKLQGQQPPCISMISSSVPQQVLPLSGNTGAGENDFF